MANINIGGRLHSSATGNVVSGANEILDDTKGKKQDVINAEVDEAIAGKQATIDDLSTIRSGAAAGATAYQKPGTGIPKSDTAPDVQTSLGKADTAYQKPSGGIPKSDTASGVQQSLDLADSAIQADPIGTIVPPVDPSEFATKEEVEGLEAKVDGQIGPFPSANLIDERDRTIATGAKQTTYSFTSPGKDVFASVVITGCSGFFQVFNASYLNLSLYNFTDGVPFAISVPSTGKYFSVSLEQNAVADTTIHIKVAYDNVFSCVWNKDEELRREIAKNIFSRPTIKITGDDVNFVHALKIDDSTGIASNTGYRAGTINFLPVFSSVNITHANGFVINVYWYGDANEASYIGHENWASKTTYNAPSGANYFRVLVQRTGNSSFVWEPFDTVISAMTIKSTTEILHKSVLVTAQSFNDAEKKQARENIGSAYSTDLDDSELRQSMRTGKPLKVNNYTTWLTGSDDDTGNTRRVRTNAWIPVIPGHSYIIETSRYAQTSLSGFRPSFRATRASTITNGDWIYHLYSKFTIPAGYNFVKLTFTAPSGTTLTTQDAEDFNVHLVDVTGGISAGENGGIIAHFEYSASRYAQGMTFYGGYIFQAFSNGDMDVYDYDGNLVDSKHLTNDVALHCNVLQFGLKSSSSDEFPLLWTSANDRYSADHKLHGFRITRSGNDFTFEEIAEIELPDIAVEMWTHFLDFGANRLITQYYDSNGDCGMKLYSWVGTLNDETEFELIDEWNNGLRMYPTQDGRFVDGFLYYVYGISGGRMGLAILNTITKEFDKIVDLRRGVFGTINDEEPEGFDFREGRIFFSTTNGLYRLSMA